jgi:hypothetical protein
LTRNGAERDPLRLVTPETRYAKAGDVHIAYQVWGDGPIDMVVASEFWHSMEVQWELPEFAAYL